MIVSISLIFSGFTNETDSCWNFAIVFLFSSMFCCKEVSNVYFDTFSCSFVFISFNYHVILVSWIRCFYWVVSNWDSSFYVRVSLSLISYILSWLSWSCKEWVFSSIIALNWEIYTFVCFYKALIIPRSKGKPSLTWDIFLPNCKEAVLSCWTGLISSICSVSSVYLSRSSLEWRSLRTLGSEWTEVVIRIVFYVRVWEVGLN